jgi:hypothetical protein
MVRLSAIWGWQVSDMAICRVMTDKAAIPLKKSLIVGLVGLC